MINNKPIVKFINVSMIVMNMFTIILFIVAPAIARIEPFSLDQMVKLSNVVAEVEVLNYDKNDNRIVMEYIVLTIYKGKRKYENKRFTFKRREGLTIPSYAKFKKGEIGIFLLESNKKSDLDLSFPYHHGIYLPGTNEYREIIHILLDSKCK